MKKSIVALTLGATLAAGCTNFEVDNFNSERESIDKSELKGPNITSLIIESINRVNSEVASSKPMRLLFAQNVCIAWPIPDGYSIVRNPVLYENSLPEADIALMLKVNNYSNISGGPFRIDFQNSDFEVSNMDEVILPIEAELLLKPSNLGKLSLHYENEVGWIEDETGIRYAESFSATIQNFDYMSNVICPDNQLLSINSGLTHKD